MTANKKRLSANFASLANRDNVFLSSAHLISKDDIEWSSESLLGQGGSASVFKGSFRGTTVAVKMYHFDNFKLPDNQNVLKKEAAELVKLDNKHVIGCHGVCLEKGVLGLGTGRETNLPWLGELLRSFFASIN